MDINKILMELTLDEKASLCAGASFWRTQAVERLGVPSVMVSDGPHGLRKQNEGGDHLGVGESINAVCFPTASALAASFDRDLAQYMGGLLGNEAQAENLAMVLGPGLNIKRSPLCGRNFEYFSEDPYLAGQMAAAFTKGVQGKGVSVCLKHFAANNQETMRMTGSSQVDIRTLHEIYLAAFEQTVRDAQPHSIMSSYNQINGVFSSENRELLTDILRGKWGFDGVVVTDWSAVKDRVKGLQAGLDLEMPGPGGQKQKILDAINNGSLDKTDLDKAVSNWLRFVEWHMANRDETAVFDRVADGEAAARIAAQCAVLLKNENEVLPLDKNAKLAFIGDFAQTPRYQGAGSSHINASHVVSALEAAEGMNVSFAQGYRAKEAETDTVLLAEAVAAARTAEAAVLFVGLPDAFESEGFDRTHLDMPANQIELIEAVAAVQPNTVVVLHNGAPIVMPWLDNVPAVLEMYLGGQGVGRAAVALLTGEVNPSGKLAESFPEKLSDNPSYLNFPGEKGIVEYREGVFVGYRYYDKKEMDVLYPFGHGLSYTSFAYENLRMSANTIDDTETVTITVTIRNTGKRGGGEVVQLYVQNPIVTIIRPIRELRDFAKITLEPGESKDVSFTLDRKAFAYFEPKLGDWQVESGTYRIQIGASSRDLRLEAPIHVTSTVRVPVVYHRDTTVGELMSDPICKEMVGPVVMDCLRKVAAGVGSIGDDSDELLLGMAMEMPLSALVSFGTISDAELDVMILQLNG